MTLLAWIGMACLLVGVLWGVVGGIGMLRLPDFFSRLHAASMTDTGCAGLVVLGLMLQAQDWQTVIKLLMILFFLLFTTPTASHALSKAAVRDGQLAGVREYKP